MTMYCSGMWWPSTTTGGFINTTLFMAWSGFTFYNLLSAMFHGPGYLPLNWAPVGIQFNRQIFLINHRL